MKKTTLPVKDQYRSKKCCLVEADRIIKEELLDAMDRKAIAREIYFHAKAYRLCERTGRFNRLREHADPIQLSDSGDTTFRRIVYRLTWIFGR